MKELKVIGQFALFFSFVGLYFYFSMPRPVLVWTGIFWGSLYTFCLKKGFLNDTFGS